MIRASFLRLCLFFFSSLGSANNSLCRFTFISSFIDVRTARKEEKNDEFAKKKWNTFIFVCLFISNKLNEKKIKA